MSGWSPADGVVPEIEVVSSWIIEVRRLLHESETQHGSVKIQIPLRSLAIAVTW